MYKKRGKKCGLPALASLREHSLPLAISSMNEFMLIIDCQPGGLSPFSMSPIFIGRHAFNKPLATFGSILGIIHGVFLCCPASASPANPQI